MNGEDNTLKIDGWELAHTGGNCTGLQRDTPIAMPGRSAAPVSGHWFMTQDGDPSAPEEWDQPVVLGLYDGDGFAQDHVPYPNAEAALVAVAAAEGRAVDLIARAISVIEEIDGGTDEDGHGPLLRELRALIGGK